MNYTSLKELIEIDSPTGFTHIAAEYCFNYLKNLGFNPTYTIKGAVKCSLGENPTLCIAGHLDTLGAIISSINGDGTLSVSLLGVLPNPYPRRSNLYWHALAQQSFCTCQ